jgi:hypothetical protein
MVSWVVRIWLMVTTTWIAPWGLANGKHRRKTKPEWMPPMERRLPDLWVDEGWFDKSITMLAPCPAAVEKTPEELESLKEAVINSIPKENLLAVLEPVFGYKSF